MSKLLFIILLDGVKTHTSVDAILHNIYKILYFILRNKTHV